MNKFIAFTALSLCVASPSFAQDNPHKDHGASMQPAKPDTAPMNMKGMNMGGMSSMQMDGQTPAKAMPQKPKARAVPSKKIDDTAVGKPVQDMPEMGNMSGMEGMDSMMSATGSEMAIPPPDAGNGVPPDTPKDYAADAFFPKADMERSREALRREHGGARVSKIMLDELEYSRMDGEDAYRWNGEAWFGGDINRLVLKSEGEGAKKVGDAEVQALYSRAIGPYTDLQAGVRYDIEPNPSRTYMALGIQSLLPYWFEAGGAVFIGQSGQVLARAEGSYDFLLTQRLALQPRAELNFAAKDDPAIGKGSGITDAELGLRLRYEVRREFAPYIGVVWNREFGGTADYTRAAGEDRESTSFVIGLRAWY